MPSTIGFRFVEGLNATIAFAPNWFLVLVSVALAGAPWLHLSYRFSLRTLLIAMTLVAVVLGLVCYIFR